MADLNKVFLMGNLTFDPELRRTPSGTAVCELRLVTSRSWNSRDGERREEKLFIDVTVWDRQAENCCQYLHKGSPIHVEGSLKMDTWDDKSTGEKRSKIRVTAERVQFLDRRGDPQAEGGSGDDYGSAPSREAGAKRGSSAPGRGPSGPGEPGGASEPSARSSASSAAANVSVGAPDDEAEDIPF
jgi:single-strand DNA-binding protein